MQRAYFYLPIEKKETIFTLFNYMADSGNSDVSDYYGYSVVWKENWTAPINTNKN